ncbi:MAG: insulinase family protein [Deltaproteobacteria bacterium]|nr:insulinase family protein [Deltaproteobacteria bacterium]
MVAFLILSVGLAHALPASPPHRLDMPDYRWEQRALCFPSGLQVAVARRPDVPVAAVTMVIGGGKSAESEEARGTAHLLEHLWFRSLQDGETSVNDRSAGLATEATTSLDATVYTTIGASEDLAAMLALEAARLRDPLAGITDEVFEAEKRVIDRELLFRGGESRQGAIRLLEEALFPEGHPYHGARLTAASSAALKLDDVRAFASRNYVPANVTIRIEGDILVDADAVVSMVDDAFPNALLDGAGSRCVHRASADVPAPVTAELQIAEAAVWNQTLYLGWAVPPGYDEDYVTMRLAAGMLEAEIDYRLYWVRGLTAADRGLAGTNCIVYPGQVASSLVCSVVLPLGVKAPAVVRAVKTGLPNLWAHTQQPWHLWYVTTTAPEVWTTEMADAVQIDHAALGKRARWIHFAEDPDPFYTLASMAGRIESSTLTAFSEKWLQKDRMAAALLVPEPAASVDRSTEPPWSPVLEARADLNWRPVRGDPSRIKETRLERGLRLWTAPSGQGAPPYAIAEMQGEWVEPPTGAQDALAALAVWRPPTSTERLCLETSTWWTHWFGTRSTGVWTAGSAGNLDAQMWLLRVYLDTLEFDVSARQARLDAWSQWAFRDEAFAMDYLLSNPWVVGDWKRREAVVGASGPGLPWWERNRAARYLRVKEVREWQRAVFQPDRTVVMVAGATSEEATRELAEQYLGGWKVKPVERPAEDRPRREPAQTRVFFVPMEKPLTEVAVSCPVGGRTSDTDAALEVLEGVVRRGMWQTFREPTGLHARCRYRVGRRRPGTAERSGRGAPWRGSPRCRGDLGTPGHDRVRAAGGGGRGREACGEGQLRAGPGPCAWGALPDGVHLQQRRGTRGSPRVALEARFRRFGAHCHHDGALHGARGGQHHGQRPRGGYPRTWPPARGARPASPGHRTLCADEMRRSP